MTSEPCTPSSKEGVFLSLDVTMATSLCLLARRSDSDSEGENPEKKKLQEQLMGMSNAQGLLFAS